MQFEDVIDYLVAMVGLKLQPINSANDPIEIISIEHEKRRYTLGILKDDQIKQKKSRAFSELEKIWNALALQGFVSVEQALNGAGSSRNQPETILANLPCIEHFKYARGKHLYLRSNNTHPLGTLQELTPVESRELKKKIDHYRDFDMAQFHSEHSRILGLLRQNLNNTFVKYPGESDVEQVEKALTELDELQDKLAISVVALESDNVVADDSLTISGRNYDEDEVDEEYQEFFGKSEVEEQESQYLVATRISQVTPTVSLLYDRINHGEIDLQPEFQRKDRIWPLRDKSRLIESVLLGLPIPAFYFAEHNESNNDDLSWIVIDGLQRTTTLYDFMKGEFDLCYLERRAELNGSRFKDLPRKEQRRIREYQIHGHLIQVSSESDDMVRELFQRINTSGKNLSYQEIRSALYPGSANQFLKYIAGTTDFKNATLTNINPERMLDLEYVLRALSYIYLGYSDFSYKKYDDFLCETLKQLNQFTFVEQNQTSHPLFIELEKRLSQAFFAVKVIFADGGYRKELTGKLNKPLFELQVAVFALMNKKQLERLCLPDIATEIKQCFYNMVSTDSADYAEWSSEVFAEQNRGFDYAISNSTGKAVTIKFRFESFINLLNRVASIDFVFKPLKEQYRDN